jgi:hypothetical protein
MLRILSYDTNDVDDMFDAMHKVVKDIQKTNRNLITTAGEEAVAKLRALANGVKITDKKE